MPKSLTQHPEPVKGGRSFDHGQGHRGGRHDHGNPVEEAAQHHQEDRAGEEQHVGPQGIDPIHGASGLGASIHDNIPCPESYDTNDPLPRIV